MRGRITDPYVIRLQDACDLKETEVKPNNKMAGKRDGFSGPTGGDVAHSKSIGEAREPGLVEEKGGSLSLTDLSLMEKKDRLGRGKAQKQIKKRKLNQLCATNTALPTVLGTGRSFHEGSKGRWGRRTVGGKLQSMIFWAHKERVQGSIVRGP